MNQQLDPIQQLESLKTKRADLEKQQARAEANLDNIQVSIKETVEQLRAEFGVSSMQEATALLGQMETEFTSLLAQVQSILED